MSEEIKMLGNIYSEKFTGGSYAGTVFSTDGIGPTLRTCGGGNQQPMILELNPENDGTCRTIKAQYARNSAANCDRPREHSTDSDNGEYP